MSSEGGEGGDSGHNRQAGVRKAILSTCIEEYCHDMTSKFYGRGGWGQ